MTVIEDSFLIPVSNYRGGKKNNKIFWLSFLYYVLEWERGKSNAPTLASEFPFFSALLVCHFELFSVIISLAFLVCF